MPLVSVTRLRVRSWRFLPSFFLQALRAARQATVADGNMAVRVLRDRRNTFWTATMWTTPEAMKKFMLAGVHRQVMPKLLNWCDEAAVLHWTQEGSNLPAWTEVWRRLQTEGRRSKVNHPSPVHIAHQFPEPLSSAGRELRLK